MALGAAEKFTVSRGILPAMDCNGDHLFVLKEKVVLSLRKNGANTSAQCVKSEALEALSVAYLAPRTTSFLHLRKAAPNSPA